MRTPDEVVAILRLHDQGWGTRRIAREVGCDRETVKRYLASGRWASCRVARRPGAPDQISHLGPGVATVSDDALDEGKALTGLAQQRLRPISVLHVGAMNVDAQQQAKRVDEDMALAPENLFARVIAGRIKRAPPFSAPFALCASMIAVVGLASRLAASRLWT